MNPHAVMKLCSDPFTDIELPSSSSSLTGELGCLGSTERGNSCCVAVVGVGRSVSVVSFGWDHHRYIRDCVYGAWSYCWQSCSIGRSSTYDASVFCLCWIYSAMV
jgi:hypothetical protein